MSFAGTPLGQGRRLDHQTFLGKPPSSNGSTGNNNPQTQRITPVPTSYSSGAPPLGSRSPPKPSSSRERVDTTNLNPEKWSVRDTSVNAASAIYQAMSNPNTAWASSSRTARTSNPPRSTSVEYESQASNNARRLGAPPSRLGSKTNNKPLSMNSSSRSIVPDSEGEQSQSQILDYSREKSPFSFDQLTNLAQTAIQKTSYFVREKQREDQQPNGNASYDYSAEEREYQQYERNVNANASSSKNLSSSAVHRKNRISTDNKAYKPSQEELEESSDDDVSDTRRRRRKKGASGPAGGPLTTLPKVGPEKRRKKGSRKTKGGAANGEEEDEEEETDKEQNISASQRASVPPPARRSQSRQPDNSLSFIHNQSHSLNLDAIPEDPDPDLVDPESNPGEFYDDSYSHRSYLDDTHSLTSLRPSSGIGARLGTIVYTLFRLIGTGLTSVAHFAGRALGQIVSVLVLWPIRGVLKLPKNPLAYYFLVAFIILFGAWMVNKVPTGLSPSSSGWRLTSSWPFSTSGGSIKFTPPALPVENVAELNARLRALESTLSALVLENEQTKTRLRMTEEEVKEYEKERAKEAKEKEREQVTERQRERSRMQQQALEREKDRERATQQGKSEPGEIKEIVGRLGALEGLVKTDISGRVSKVEDVVGGFNRIQERKEKEERERQARLAVEAKEAREAREREERFKERLERDVREREQKERERDQREREKENQRQKEEKERQQREERERLVLNQVKKEMESLKSVIGALQSQPSSGSGSSSVGSDIEARTQLALLEERIGSIEGGVKEALDIGNNALKTIKSSSQHPDSQSNWWSKISPSSSSKSSLTIKSTDGQDVTSLLTHLVSSAVSSAVSIHSKDSIARADYALHSGGARVIPSLTSDTFALRTPSTFTSQLLGLIPFSGSGFGFGGPGSVAVGRPPVWALHPDITNGLCWPFPGSHGQLGIALAAPVVVDSVTIDHVAAETAYEDGLVEVEEEGQDGDEDVEDGHVEKKTNRRRSKRRSAPREMEVWGLVEGRENIHKVKEWRERLITQRQAKNAARERGEEQDFNHLDDLLGTSELDVPYPSTLPKSPTYIRLASFTYDIHSPSHIQTFPVLPYLSKYGKLGEAGVDFGVVVLVVRSNWGMEEYTCLYRVRVHGERGMIGGIEESW